MPIDDSAPSLGSTGFPLCLLPLLLVPFHLFSLCAFCSLLFLTFLVSKPKFPRPIPFQTQPLWLLATCRPGHTEHLIVCYSLWPRCCFISHVSLHSFEINFYWSVVALQCCDSFYGTAKWISCMFIYAWVISHFSRVCFFETPWTVAYRTPLSMGFSKQEYWRGSPCPPPGIFPTRGWNLHLLQLLLVDSLSLSHGGGPYVYIYPLVFGFPSHLGQHRALSWVTCAIQ